MNDNTRRPLVPGAIPNHPLFKNLTGDRFGKLLVLRYAGRIGTSHAFQCKCDCGGEVTTRGYCLTSGATKSCGCLLPEWIRENKTTHGMSHVQEFRIWQGMKNRCLNSNVKCYDRYGGAGVTVCDRWINGENGQSGFECFYADVGVRPSKGHSLDRYPECDGNYQPDNVRWATASQQQHNKSGNPRIEYQGRSLQTVEWEAETGIPASEISKRIRRGWTPKRALTQPLRGSVR